jgi:hypothetical protein
MYVMLVVSFYVDLVAYMINYQAVIFNDKLVDDCPTLNACSKLLNQALTLSSKLLTQLQASFKTSFNKLI